VTWPGNPVSGDHVVKTIHSSVSHFAPGCCWGAEFLDVVGSLVRNSSLSSSDAEEYEERVEEPAAAMLVLMVLVHSWSVEVVG